MKPRFSLHELFLAMTLIAMGSAGIAVLIRAPGAFELINAAAPFIYFGSAIAIGVGLGVPFQNRTTGGVLGFLAALFSLPLIVLFR